MGQLPPGTALTRCDPPGSWGVSTAYTKHGQRAVTEDTSLQGKLYSAGILEEKPL